MTQDQKLKDKNDFAKVVCLFLAEGLRTRKIGLLRASEIAQKVVDNINLLDTETDFLRLIKELSKDFEELVKLEDRVSLYIKSDERTKMETTVKEYVAKVLASNSQMAMDLIKDALKPGTDFKSLAAKYPEFKSYLEKKNASQRNIQN